MLHATDDFSKGSDQWESPMDLVRLIEKLALRRFDHLKTGTLQGYLLGGTAHFC